MSFMYNVGLIFLLLKAFVMGVERIIFRAFLWMGNFKKRIDIVGTVRYNISTNLERQSRLSRREKDGYHTAFEFIARRGNFDA